MAYPIKESPVPSWIADRFGSSKYLKNLGIKCYCCEKLFDVFIADIVDISVSQEEADVQSVSNSIRSSVITKTEFTSRINLLPACLEHAKGYDLVLCSLEMVNKTSEFKFNPKTASAIVDGTYRSIRLKDNE